MEEWKLLEKENMLFNVSNKGRVQILRSSRTGPVRKLIQTIGYDGFSQKGGHESSRYLSTHGHYVHRLVAEAWVAPIIEGKEVNHINGNKHDNRAENLEVITCKKNIQHSFKVGAHRNIFLTKDEIERRKTLKEIHRMNKQWLVLDLDFNTLGVYETQSSAAESIKVSRQAANNSFKKGNPLLKMFYICRREQVKELKVNIRIFNELPYNNRRKHNG